MCEILYATLAEMVVAILLLSPEKQFFADLYYFRVALIFWVWVERLQKIWDRKIEVNLLQHHNPDPGFRMRRLYIYDSSL